VRLHDPWWLAALVLLPLLLHWWRSDKSPGLRYPLADSLSEIDRGARARWRWIVPAMRAVGFALLVLALALPQLGKAASRIHTEGIDVMIAVDVSGSMRAEDFTVDGMRASRFQAVQSVVRSFVQGRPNDRIGLVLFASRPYTQCPLTLDHGWLLENLERARIGMIEDGTAVGSALATAVNRLEASKAKSKVVVLLTDGQNNAGRVSPLTAADAAKTLGYRVYTIGAGTHGLAPFPVRGPFGGIVYQPMPVDIDEDTLRRIAATTGGRYFRATDTASLEKIWSEIDRLEKSPHEGAQYLAFRELYGWLALPGFALLLGEAVLGETWLRVLP
jgi:Ca-activated chloride channel homolog